MKSVRLKRIIAGVMALAVSLSAVNFVALADNDIKLYSVGDEAVTLYPTADIQFRKNNPTDYGTSKGFEVRNDNTNGENAFLGALKFDISSADLSDIKSATLELVTETRDNSGNFVIKPLSDDWSEDSGNKYSDKEGIINEALSADTVAEFQAAWGGKKLFEATGVDEDKRVIANWTSHIDITQYVNKVIDANSTVISLLITPQNFTNSNGAAFLSKDISKTSYNNDLRWEAILSAFSSEISDADLDLLKPRLIIEYYQAGEIPAPDSVAITGDTKINSFGKASNHTYTAKVLDQFEHEMSGETVTWSVDSTAVSINEKTGVLTIPADTPAQTVTITATSKTDSNVSGSLDVTIICEDTSLKSELVSGVRMRGKGNNTYVLYPELGNELGMNANAVAILKFDISNTEDKRDYLSKIVLNLKNTNTSYKDMLGAWIYTAPDGANGWTDADWAQSANANTIRDNISLVLGADDYKTSGISGSGLTEPLTTAAMDSDGNFSLEFTGDALKQLLAYAKSHNDSVEIVVTRGNTAATSGRTDADLANAYLSMTYSRPASIKIFKGSTEIEESESIDLAGIDTYPFVQNYTAKLYDEDGNEMTAFTPSWSSFKTTVKENKVKFNTDTGKLTIPEGAAVQTATITASCEGIKKSIEINIDTLVPETVEIDGEDSINNYIASTERKFIYKAIVKDQHGGVMEDQSVTWEFTTDATENAATFNKGTLTVPANVADQTITITAKCGDIKAEKTVTISKTILDLPETFTADRSMKLRGFGNTSTETAHLAVDPVSSELGMKAYAPGMFRFDLSKVIADAGDVITGLEFTAYKQGGTSIALGIWEYADPKDTERKDGKTWIDTDWTNLDNRNYVKNNYSLIFGIDDFAASHTILSENYADGRTSYIAPITTASIDSDNKYVFTVTGEALDSIIAHAKENNGYVELVINSADLDARSASINMYMTGVKGTDNEKFIPTLKVSYDLPSTPRKIDITGENTLYINSRVSSYTARYSAAVYDQSGNLYADQEVEWSADLGKTDVSFADGVLTVSSAASEGTVTLTAKSAYAEGTKVITLKKIPDGLKNGSFENVDDSYLADGWTPNVPYYKVNFDKTDYYGEKWTDAKTNDAGTLFTRTQQYALTSGVDETTEQRGTSDINSVVKVEYTSALSDEEATDLMNTANQTIGVNNAIKEAFMQVGYEIPYYYMFDYYLSRNAELVLSNQGIYGGLEFRNKADNGYLSTVATGNQYVPFTKGQWRTYTGSFTSGTANQINGQTRVNLGVSGMKGTAYIDYFRLIPKGIDTSKAADGSNSMQVANALEWESDMFSVESGSYYTYQASVRPDTSVVEGQITYTFMDSSFTPKGEFVVSTEDEGWTNADENGWITISGQTAVPAGASICKITLLNPNKAGNVWFDNLVFAKTEEAKADTVRITGGVSEAVIPASGTNTYQYTAVVYDQYNNVMSSEVTWSVTNAAGVSITSGGILKVSSSANEGKVTVTVTKDGKTVQKEVSLVRQGEVTEPEGDLNGSFTDNDGESPAHWTNSGSEVIVYTFDSGTESWKASRTDYGASVDGEMRWDESQNYTAQKQSGSLLLYNPSHNMPIATVPYDVKISGGMPYEFELMFKEQGVSDDSTVRAHLRYFNSTGGTIAETPNMLKYYPEDYAKEADGNGWQKWSGTEVVPTNASTVRVDVRFRGGLNNDDGYAWFDDIKIKKLTGIDEENTYNGNPSLMLIGYNEDETTAGKEYGERWVSDKLTNISQGVAYSYSAMLQTYDAASGAYLSFIFYDADGNEISTVKSDRVTDTTNSWEELSGSVVAPSGADSVSVAYNLDGKGTSWISGITFNAMTDTAVSDIKINGASSVKIPSGGSKSESYTVNTVNSEGNAVGAADAEITASNLPNGVTFKNGVLTVSSSASAGTVTLRASYDGKSDTKTVTITKTDTSSGNTGGGGGGGGAGGGTTVNNTLKPSNTPQPDSSPMGHVEYGGSSAAIDPTGSKNINDTAQIPTLLRPPALNYFTGGDGDVIFEDIDGVPWAKNAIEILYKAGVVSGRGDKIFAPHDNVTRAEFITMLIKAFRITSENRENSFSDVNFDDWFYDTVNIAVGEGIVSGISDDYFGSYDNITRQDITVMGTRLWDSIGKDMTGNYRVAFTDLDDISDYALDSVVAMTEAGIVSGMDTGEFLPHANATRAQAAVIIYRMAVKYDE